MTLLPFGIAALIVLVVFISALKNGVVRILASGLSTCAAFIVLFGLINFLPSILQKTMNIALNWQFLVGSAVVAAIVVYFISVLIFGAVFRFLFRHGGFLHDCSDGIIGGLLSLFPSLLVVFFVFVCLRMTGTVMELNYVGSISQPNVQEATNKFPAWPKLTVWRNQLESIPGAAPLFDAVDPFSRRENRNLAALLLMKQRVFLSNYLGTRDDSIDLLEDPAFEALMEDKIIFKKLENHDRIGLVMNSDLQKAAKESSLRGNLRDWNLRDVVEDLIELLPNASMKKQ